MRHDLVVEWMKRYPLARLENEIILVRFGIEHGFDLDFALYERDPGSGEPWCVPYFRYFRYFLGCPASRAVGAGSASDFSETRPAGSAGPL